MSVKMLFDGALLSVVLEQLLGLPRVMCAQDVYVTCVGIIVMC